MKAVAGLWGLEVTVNGQDLGLDPSNLSHLYVVSNINQALPSLSIGFKDDTGAALDNLMGDGASVKVSIGNPSYHMYNGLDFIVSGMPEVNPYSGSSNHIKFNGVLNRVKWLRKMVDKPYKGTSANVIAQLASEAGLIPDIDSAMDFMTWLPNQTSLVSYANHVLNRSFAGEGNALVMGIMDNAKLKLKSLNTLIGNSGITLSSNSDLGLNVLQWVTRSKAGSTNFSHGYGSTSLGLNLDGTIFEGNNVAVKLMSSATSIMSGIKDIIGDVGTRINALAPLAGNTHDNWYKALHQNPRILSTYAFDIELITDVPTRLELLDTPTFRPYNVASNQEATSISGKYIVTAITKFIQNNRYFEKIVLTAQGPNGIG